MLSAPKTPEQPHHKRCPCDVCHDDHVRWAADLNADTTTTAKDWWTALNEQPTEAAPTGADLAAFDADMAALNERITKPSKETP